MNKSLSDGVNFWPGYVDALVNVVLNLLFLVGIFTIGLVALSMDAVFTQGKIARVKIEHVLEIELRAERLERALALLAKLPKADVEMSEVPHVREVHLNAPYKPISPKTTVALQTPDQVALALSGGKQLLTKFIFQKNQFTLLEDEPSMVRPSEENKSQKVLLLVISDRSNPRLAHEAFTRLVSVRTTMIRNGFDQKNITLRVIPNSTMATHLKDIDLSVFVVQISQ